MSLARILRRIVKEARHLVGAFQNWTRDDGPLMSAAVAYYLGLSLLPLLLLLSSVFGIFLEYTELGQSAEQHVLHTVATHLSPSIESNLKQSIAEVKDRSAFNGPVGLAGILLASLAGFAQFDRAMDRIWNIHPQASQGILKSVKRILVQRGVALLMLLGLAALITIAFLANITISAIDSMTEYVLPAPDILWRISQPLASFLINILILTMLYRWLPKRKVHWREALRGGVFAGIGWELGRLVLDAYLIGNKYTSTYGVLGSFIAIQLWCYYSVSMIFLGAEYIQEFCRHCSSDETDESAGNQQVELRHAGSGGRQSMPAESERILQRNF